MLQSSVMMKTASSNPQVRTIREGSKATNQVAGRRMCNCGRLWLFCKRQRALIILLNEPQQVFVCCEQDALATCFLRWEIKSSKSVTITVPQAQNKHTTPSRPPAARRISPRNIIRSSNNISTYRAPLQSSRDGLSYHGHGPYTRRHTCRSECVKCCSSRCESWIQLHGDQDQCIRGDCGHAATTKGHET